MDQLLKHQPQDFWKWFVEISNIPRGSGFEQQIMDYIIDFAKKRGLDYHQDKTGNVLIKKTKQHCQQNKTIVLQAHSDMVWQKSADHDFDFHTQPIELVLEDDWLKANKTTLGADDGFGVASILAILDNHDIPHANLECLITISEEIGLIGANKLALPLTGSVLINLDSEDSRSIVIGCAGASTTCYQGTYPTSTINVNGTYQSYILTIKDASGGHSGVQIHEGRANAIKLLARILVHLNNEYTIHLVNFYAKGADNAISSYATSTILIDQQVIDQFNQQVKQLQSTIQEEFAVTDPNIKLVLQQHDISTATLEVVEDNFKDQCLHALNTVVNGVYRYNQHNPSMVETSSNIATAIIDNKIISIGGMHRSSCLNGMTEINQLFKSALFPLKVELSNEPSVYYPWQPDFNNPVVKKATHIYQQLFNEEPQVVAIHAGLEASILDPHNKLDKLSIGPDILYAHSPQETVNIKSVEKYYKFLLSLIKEL